jgi:hypothetical protein
MSRIVSKEDVEVKWLKPTTQIGLGVRGGKTI